MRGRRRVGAVSRVVNAYVPRRSARSSTSSRAPQILVRGSGQRDGNGHEGTPSGMVACGLSAGAGHCRVEARHPVRQRVGPERRHRQALLAVGGCSPARATRQAAAQAVRARKRIQPAHQFHLASFLAFCVAGSGSRSCAALRPFSTRSAVSRATSPRSFRRPRGQPEDCRQRQDGSGQIGQRSTRMLISPPPPGLPAAPLVDDEPGLADQQDDDTDRLLVHQHAGDFLIAALPIRYPANTCSTMRTTGDRSAGGASAGCVGSFI